MSKRRLQLSRPDFSAVSSDRTAKRITTPHFSITYSKKGAGTAVVVSKKVAKSSVQRHLIKRRVREAIAPFCDDAHALIVYARAGAAALPYSEMVEELTKALLGVVS
jgi:ribonuclease P protein component